MRNFNTLNFMTFVILLLVATLSTGFKMERAGHSGNPSASITINGKEWKPGFVSASKGNGKITFTFSETGPGSSRQRLQFTINGTSVNTYTLATMRDVTYTDGDLISVLADLDLPKTSGKVVLSSIAPVNGTFQFVMTNYDGGSKVQISGSFTDLKL